MRVHYQIEGQSSWSELDHLKAGIQSNDVVVCHTEVLRDRFMGERLVMGIDFKVLFPTSQNVHIEKDPGGLVFFTKCPTGPSSHKRMTDLVGVSFDLGPNWFDTL